METDINTCLNQTSSWRYYAEVEEHQLTDTSNNYPSKPRVQFHVDPKSNPIYILVKEEMLIIDSIDLFGNLGGLLGLFVGFSFFGYSSALIDFIFIRLHKGVTSGVTSVTAVTPKLSDTLTGSQSGGQIEPTT